jgi:hypothetical protein
VRSDKLRGRGVVVGRKRDRYREGIGLVRKEEERRKGKEKESAPTME